MVQENQKISIGILAFCFSVISVIFCNTAHMGITFYWPVMLLAVFMQIFTLLRGRNIKLRQEHFCILFLVLIICLNMNATLEYFDSSKTIFATLILFMFFFVFALRTPNLAELIFLSNAFVLSVVIISLIILLFGLRYGEGRKSISLFYTFIDPNYLASFMSAPAIIILKRFLYPRGSYYRLKWGLIALIVISAIFLTGSRGAFVAIIFASLTLLCYRAKYFPFYLLGLCILLGAIFFILPGYITDRFLHTSYNDGSNRQRISQWTTALLRLKEQPLLMS